MTTDGSDTGATDESRPMVECSKCEMDVPAGEFCGWCGDQLDESKRKGPKWFAELGPANSGGTVIFSVSGHVAKGGNFELPMGVVSDSV